MRERPLSPEDVEALEGEDDDVIEVEGEVVVEDAEVSWSILLLPEMKSSSIWSMHCRRWSCKRERERAIRGHLGDYKSSFVSHGQDKKTVCPSNLFHFPS